MPTSQVVQAVTVEAILQSAFRRKKMRHPAYSIRALARDWEVSPAFASKVMAGKKLPPKERLERLAHLLELDVPEKEKVLRALLIDRYGAKVAKAPCTSEKRKTVNSNSRPLLGSWINLAVLEGLSLPSPHNELEPLRARLGVDAVKFQRALRILEETGLIERAGDTWRKRESHLYVAGGRSMAEVRAFHGMMIEKGKSELLKTGHDDYQRRLINGFTLAVNPEHLERAKAKIIAFLDELSREASEGNATEVYQCNVQFFPLTKPAET